MLEKIRGDSWRMLDIEGVDDEILHPRFQCDTCAKPINRKYHSDRDPSYCYYCKEKYQHMREQFDRTYAVTIYLSQEESDSHRLSNQLRPPKTSHIDKKARLLEWGMNEFGRLFTVDAIVVPPSSSDGENHMALVADRVAESVDVPFRDIITGDISSSQKNIETFEERQENVCGNVYCSGEVDDIESAVIIDDIITTGSIISETAKVIREEGVKFVFGLCIGRSVDLEHLEQVDALMGV